MHKLRKHLFLEAIKDDVQSVLRSLSLQCF